MIKINAPLSFVKLACIFLIVSSQAFATAKVTLSGKMPKGNSGISFFTLKGYVVPGTLTGGDKFSVVVNKNEVAGGSLIVFTAQHQIGGAVVLGQKSSSVSFVKFKSIKAKTLKLGQVIKNKKGYFRLKSYLPDIYDSKLKAKTSLLSAPLGLNVQSASAKKITTLGENGDGDHGGNNQKPANLGADTDHDGLPDALDIDSDGDGGVDVLAGVHGETPEMPYLIVREEIQDSLNVTATGIPTSEEIDTLLSNSVLFNMGFAFEVRDNASAVTGAHVVCEDSNLLCGSVLGRATTNNSFGGLWRDYHPDGSTYPGLELSQSQSDSKFFNTGLTVHVGPSSIRPGDTYRIEFTDASGAVVRSKQATVAPYLITVPALHSYAANGSEHVLDYANIANEAGALHGPAPITIGSDGLLTVHFWRPQRQRIGGTDGEGYVDAGGLRYGITILGHNGDPSCTGFYTNLSSTLSESVPDAEHSHTYNPWPLNDSASDSATAVDNQLSFTVDLKSCLQSNNFESGEISLSLQAAGADLGHGANRSGQDFKVFVP